MSAFLIVDDLHVRFSDSNGRAVHALNGVNLHVRAGEALGVLGESGSGKSTLAKGLLRILPRNAEIPRGTITFEGRNLLQLSEKVMNELRGARLAMIPQEPGLSLNPVMKVGDQITDVLRAHRTWDAHRRRVRAEDILQRLLPGTAGRSMYDAYPHQLSGGQQQRVVIAQALACEPALIVADEPTAALDAATEGEILEVFRKLKAERRRSLILITHDPTILRELTDRVAVMYAGRVVEQGPTHQILTHPRHPYVQGLLACILPQDGLRVPGRKLRTIAGSPPDPRGTASGCNFFPRCSERIEKCEFAHPGAQGTPVDTHVECFLYE
jgi:oligopeptide/dipeptide ABC transporter ATP-binding protein